MPDDEEGHPDVMILLFPEADTFNAHGVLLYIVQKSGVNLSKHCFMCCDVPRNL
jgi:hypothetical protein